VESPPPPPCVCMSIHPERRTCSYLGRDTVLNDPPAYSLKVSHAPISVEWSFSMTLLPGAGVPLVLREA
jgi:hypothetical protein